MRVAQGWIVWFPATVVIAWSTAGWCGEAVPHGYRAVAADYGIPYTVLYAVALVESGVGSNGDGVRRPWPWTLNVAGRPYVYATHEAAWRALNAFIAGGERSIDIGLMQVNWRFHREALGDSWRALDPYHNLRVGAAILQDCFAQRHDWWAGVGCYHSPGDGARAQRYWLRVVGQWRQLAVDDKRGPMKKLSYIKYGLLLIGMTLAPLTSGAVVIVIYDSGATRPLAPFLESLKGSTPSPRPPSTGALRLGAGDVRTLLPIRSPGLSPGPVPARSQDRPFSRPFFLIGSDDRSRQWLGKHRDRLKAIGAVGMLVQAESLEDLRTTAELSRGLPIMPASGADIAAALHISHYPVLVTSRGIEQ